MRGTAVILVAILAAWPSHAYAYMDPATGGFLLQVGFGVIAFILVGIKLFWHNLKFTILRIKRVFTRNEPRPFDDSESDS